MNPKEQEDIVDEELDEMTKQTGQENAKAKVGAKEKQTEGSKKQDSNEKVSERA